MSSPPRRGRFAWIAVWLALATLLVARAAGRPADRGVILDHLEFGRRLLHGEDVHAPRQKPKDGTVQPLHPPYPPSFGLLTAPFSVIDATLGQRAARIAWALMQVVMLGVTLGAWHFFSARQDDGRKESARHQGWRHPEGLATLLLGARFVLRDAHGGGGNLVNVGLCTGALVLAIGGRQAVAGVLLGFSLLTKPTQVWLLPVFFLFGLRRAVGAAFATGVVGVLVTMALQRFDLTAWYRWIEGSWAIAVQADPWAVPALDFPPFEWMNQALRFAVARWCGNVPPEFAARVAWGVPPGLGLDAGTVAWITLASSLGLLGAVLVAAWRARHRPQAQPRVFAAALALSVLLSPLSWKAHHVALLPALFLLVQRAARTRSRGIIALLALWAISVALPGRDIVGDACDEWLNSVYVVTIWDVVLLLLLLRQSPALEHGDAAGGGGGRQLEPRETLAEVPRSLA